MLRKNLTNEARKRDLSNVSLKYEKEAESLKTAKVDFDEDYQRFLTMKADMDGMDQIGTERF